MSRKKFGNDAARPTTWIPAADLEVDSTINTRPLNKPWANKIGHEFNQAYLGVLHVSLRANGRMIVAAQ